MDKYGIDCIYLNNDFKCDLGNDTENCFTICKDQKTFEELEEK